MKQTPIGKKHLEIFNEVDPIKDDGKGGENLRRRSEIRKTLSFLRKTDAGLHTEMILADGRGIQTKRIVPGKDRCGKQR